MGLTVLHFLHIFHKKICKSQTFINFFSQDSFKFDTDQVSVAENMTKLFSSKNLKIQKLFLI